MFFTILILLIAVAGGIALTYLYDDETPGIFRLAAGVVIGMVVFGFAGTLIAALIGVSPVTVGLAAVASGLPVALFRDKNYLDRLHRDFEGIKTYIREFFTSFDPARVIAAVCYAGLFILIFFFFRRAMLEMPDGGIGTGVVNNLGDLPFHLQVINSFAIGQDFPPDNPIFSGSTLSYPFIADLIPAMFTVAGAGVADAMLVQNVILMYALVVLMAGFTYKITQNTFAASIAPFILAFSGGLGFLLFFGDAVKSDAGILGHIFQLNSDYTLGGSNLWRWGNALTTLFVTQRTLLLGLPVALIVFTKLFDFGGPEYRSAGETKNLTAFIFAPENRSLLIVGLLAGLLPLIHSHTFLVVGGVAGVVAVINWQNWKRWLLFFGGMFVTAVPQLLFITSGTATSAGSFIGWEFGWDHGDHNAVWFWFVNTGLFIPLLLLGCFLLALKAVGSPTVREGSTSGVSSPTVREGSTSDKLTEADAARGILLFFVPFALIFIAGNSLRLAPWIWDNIKVLIYWYVGAVPIVAYAIAEIWKRSNISFVLVPALIASLTFSGFLDVWRTASGKIEHQIIAPQVVKAAADLNSKIPRDALIMTAPEYATIAVLTGRRWFHGYTGHVWSHGISAADERQQIMKKIYAGGDEAKRLIGENKIDYIVVGPQEKQFTRVDETFFAAYPVAASADGIKVYDVRRSER